MITNKIWALIVCEGFSPVWVSPAIWGGIWEISPSTSQNTTCVKALAWGKYSGEKYQVFSKHNMCEGPGLRKVFRRKILSTLKTHLVWRPMPEESIQMKYIKYPQNTKLIWFVLCSQFDHPVESLGNSHLRIIGNKILKIPRQAVPNGYFFSTLQLYRVRLLIEKKSDSQKYWVIFPVLP